jgi:hypothetical protein
MKKGAEVFKIFTILHQNSVCHDEAVEVDLFVGVVLNLGEFVYIDKKRISGINRFSTRVIAHYFRSNFSAFNWL